MEALYERLGAPNARQLRIAALRENIPVSAKEAEEFVKNKTERQIYRQPQLSQGQTASRGMGEEYMADLIDLAVFGGSSKAVLAVLDPFHRKIALEPLSNKRPQTVLEGFRKVLQRMPTPKALSTDSDSAFKGVFEQELNQLNVVHKFRRGINSLARLDRSIQAAKKQLFQRLSKKGNKYNFSKFEDVIPLVESSMNELYNNAIGSSSNNMEKDTKAAKIEQFHLRAENADAFVHNSEVAKKKMDKIREEGAFRVQESSTFQRSYKPRYGPVKQAEEVRRSQVTDESGKIYNVNVVTAVPRDSVDEPRPDFSGRGLRDERLRTSLRRYADELYRQLGNEAVSFTTAARLMSEQFAETKPTHLSFGAFLRLFPGKFSIQGEGSQSKVRAIRRRVRGKQASGSS
jgi:hypothetical protein